MLLVENSRALWENTAEWKQEKQKLDERRKDETDERKDESCVRKQEGHFLYLDLWTSLFRNKGSDCSSQNCLQGPCSPFVDFLKNSLKEKKNNCIL